jgi:hypothetical protein
MYIHMRKHPSFQKLYDEEETKRSRHHIDADNSSRLYNAPVKAHPDQDAGDLSAFT